MTLESLPSMLLHNCDCELNLSLYNFSCIFCVGSPVSKEDMKKLRHALKTLSEAEKQLRMSNDRLTWLTAALLQLAPDQQYNLPSSSAETGFNQSPLALNTADGSHRLRSSYVQQTDIPNNSQDREENDGVGMIPQRTFSVAGRNNSVKNRHPSEKFHREIEDIWLEVLEKIHIKSIREFLYQEGQLVGVSFGAGNISNKHCFFFFFLR